MVGSRADFEVGPHGLPAAAQAVLLGAPEAVGDEEGEEGDAQACFLGGGGRWVSGGGLGLRG